MRTIAYVAATVVLSSVAVVAGAQERPAIRQLGPVVARSAKPVAVGGIRPLSSGAVLVNDPRQRRLMLLDSTLAVYTVVADSTAATGNAYSSRLGGLLAYSGDSSLFTDPASYSMMVVDPSGRIGRVMSVPSSQDAMSLAVPMAGAAYDGRGGIVYRGAFRPQMRRQVAGQAFTPPEFPDSAAVLRVELATRKLDTVAFVRTPKVSMEVSTGEDGRVTMRSRLNPLPVVDEWALLPDGTVAIVRGRDYRIDWIAPDGSRTSSPKIPFDWQRLTDDDKVAFIDSLKAARERMDSAPGDSSVAVGGGDGGGAGSPNVQIMTRPRTAAGSGGRAGAATGAAQRMPARFSFVEPEDLPDYKPAFFAGAVRADAEGNLWIRTIPTKPVPGGPVYDVVNREGALVERVQIPDGRSIIGFGPGGVVYLLAREGRNTYLERANIR